VSVRPSRIPFRHGFSSKRRWAALVAVAAVALAGLASAGNEATAAAATPADPSGVPMPTTAPAGWKFALADDFTGTSLDNNWGAFSGKPGGDPVGWWSPSHVSVSGGMLQLATYQDQRGTTGTTGWVSGGVGSRLHQTYGDYEVRMRIDGGAGVSAIALLWPQVGWPPEVDFYEDASPDDTRSWDRATLHYSSSNLQIQKWLDEVDFTQWHTLGVQWTPSQLAYTIDGQVWATVSGSEVPSLAMGLDLQTEFLPMTLTAATPPRVNMDIDWVVAYAMAP
jgi:beta-glucanase (GH16 family)